MGLCEQCGQRDAAKDSLRCGVCIDETTVLRGAEQPVSETDYSQDFGQPSQPGHRPQPPRTGDVIAGHYVLREPVGTGGMAVVYQAEDRQLRRMVAIKLMLDSLAQSQQNRERFEREARVMAGLDHENIAPVYLVGNHQGFPFFVTKLLSGENLSRLGDKGELPTSLSLTFLRQIADALDYIHGRGLVHRDVKPSNVFIESERAWLIDFGIAKQMHDPALTRTGTMMGTLWFAAPEVILGQEAVPASDQYSLALVGYWLLTKRLPFDCTSDYTVSTGKVSGLDYTQFDTLGIAEGTPAVFQQALRVNAAERYPSCGAFVDALEASLTGGSTKKPHRRRLRPALPWALAAMAVAAVVSLTVWLWSLPMTSAAKAEVTTPSAPPSIAEPQDTLAAVLPTEARKPDVLPVPTAENVPSGTPSRAAAAQRPKRRAERGKSVGAQKVTLSLNSRISKDQFITTQILIDGAPAGDTPVVLQSVSPGRHEIRFVRKGYQPYVRSVSTAAGQKVTIVAEMVPE
jgi:serine/threonine protein kinase